MTSSNWGIIAFVEQNHETTINQVSQAGGKFFVYYMEIKLAKDSKVFISGWMWSFLLTR